jgi:hypothetical protein
LPFSIHSIFFILEEIPYPVRIFEIEGIKKAGGGAYNIG